MARPNREKFVADWHYMDWQVAKGCGIIRVHDDAEVIILTAHQMEGREHRVDEFIVVETPAI